MKLLVFSYVLACSLWCSISAFAQEQQQTTTANITVSTSSTVVPSTSATFQEAYSQMLDTFPQKVLSTIATVLENSTNATSAGERKDSLLKKDNLALQMSLWSSWSGGISVKYWLSELTTLRVGVQGGLNAAASILSSQNGSAGYRLWQQDTTRNNGYTQSQAFNPNFTGSVNMDCGVSASIEKHLFPYRHLSPYIGFSVGVDVFSTNEAVFTTPIQNSVDSNGNIYLYYPYYSIPNNSRNNNTDLRLNLISRTSISVSGSVVVGVEYFFLHFLSVSGQAGISTWIGAQITAISESNQSASTLQGNQINYYDKNRNVTTVTTGNNGQVGFGLKGGANFSSSLTLSLYFGRNVLGDIVNAFKSGAVFQW